MAAEIRNVIGALAALSGISAWLLPNHYPPWTSFHNEAAGFAAVSFAAAGWLLGRGGESAPVPVRSILLLLPIIWVHWLTGLVPYFGDALVSTLYVSGLAIAFWISSELRPASIQRALFLCAVTIVSAALISIIISVLQWLRLEDALGILVANRGPGHRPFGNLAQPNHLATLLLMASALTIGLLTTGRLGLGLTIALLTLLAFGVVLTGSRTGLLGALLLGGTLLLKRNELDDRRITWLVLMWWSALVLTYIAWVPLNEALGLQASGSRNLSDDSGRLLLWRQTWAGIEASPLVGYGWRQTIAAHKVGALMVPGMTNTDYAHNLALDALAWVGVPLGTGLLLVVGWWLAKTFLDARGRSEIVLISAAVPILVHGMTEYPFAYSYFLFPLGGLLGGAWSLKQQRVALEERSSRSRAGATFFVVTFICSAIAVGLEYLKAEEDYRVLRFELRNVGSPPPDYQAPRLVFLTQFREAALMGRIEPSVGMSATELERMRVATIAFGWATLHFKYAVALGLNGKSEEATKALIHLRSTYGPFAWTQARVLFVAKQGQYPELRSVVVP